MMATAVNPFLAARLGKRMSKAELARRTGLSWSQVHRIETGQSQPSWASVQAIARALAVSPATLMER